MFKANSYTFLDTRRTVRWTSSFYFNIFIGLAFLLSFAVIFLHLLISSEGKKLLKTQNELLYTEITNQVIDNLTLQTKQARILTQSLSSTSPYIEKNKKSYMDLFPHLIDQNNIKSSVAGGGIWPEPNAFKEGIDRHSFFWGRNQEGHLEFYDDYNTTTSQGYHNEEWYVPSKWLKQGEVFWSKSYMDPYSFQPMVTCTAPTYENGKYVGCSTIDLKLEGLEEITALDSQNLNGYIFITDRNNKFLSFPDKTISKIYSESGGKKTEDFIHSSDLAETNPLFKPIAHKLEKINQDFLNSNPAQASLIEALGEQSYQINPVEAKIIASTLNEKIDLPHKNVISFDINDDLLLHEPAKVFIKLMPETYWKVVTVIPISKIDSIPNSIASKVSFIAVFVVLFSGLLTSLFFYFRLLKPLKKMIVSLKQLSHASDPDLIQLDDSSDDELGILAYWFNIRSKKLIDSLSKLQRAYQDLDITRLKAEEATKLKTEFMACMSHEIRTPMNAIIGMGQLLEEANLTDDEKNYLNIVQDSSHHLLALINDILDISKLETGKLIIRESDFSLKELTESMNSILKSKANEKGLKFNINSDSRIPDALHGDASRIKQILINLGDNAIKFTEEGFVVIDIKLKDYVDSDHLELEVSVNDSGIGIEENDVSKLCQPFTQIDSSSTRQYEGTGLGLSICRNIVEIMHGQIKYERNSQNGSCFHFTIQLKFLPEAKKQSSTINYKLPVGVTPKILLAEDNLDNQLLIQKLLSNIDLTCDIANNGQEAVDMHKENSYDLIFMDWQMPIIDGFEATKVIRKREDQSGKRSIIIAFTANAMEGDEQKCLDAGMDDYITKPFSKAKLYSLIQKYSITQ